MDYLLEDAVEFFDDVLPRFGREEAPDFLGRRGHGSYSFTRASSSAAAEVVSLVRIGFLPKSERLVQRTGKRMLLSP
jgi:hypothetical protein